MPGYSQLACTKHPVKDNNHNFSSLSSLKLRLLKTTILQSSPSEVSLLVRTSGFTIHNHLGLHRQNILFRAILNLVGSLHLNSIH